MWTNGLQLAGGGSAFPSSPTTNDVFLRTDLGALFYYDGTNWVSVSPEATACFSAYASATQTPAADTATYVQANTKEWDFGNRYDSTKFRFQAPIAGIYEFTIESAHSAPAAGEYLYVGILVNTASTPPAASFTYVLVQLIEPSTTAGNKPIGTRMVSLAAGDYVYPIVQTNGAIGNRPIVAGMRFQGKLIRGKV